MRRVTVPLKKYWHSSEDPQAGMMTEVSKTHQVYITQKSGEVGTILITRVKKRKVRSYVHRHQIQ